MDLSAVDERSGPHQIVVLGMHRSGTSGVTRLLNLAGAYFGPAEIATEANEENPRGFWERRDVREVCDGLLHAGGYDWWKLLGFDAQALRGSEVDRWLGRFSEILSELDSHRPWVIKEPRLSILFPLVRPLLDAPVCVHVSREPLEVARSMHKRNGFPILSALALWELYTLRSVEASAGLPRLHIRHLDLMADPVGVTAKLVEDLTKLGVRGLTAVPDDKVLGFISQDLHRQHESRDQRGEYLNASQDALARQVDDDSLWDRPATPTGLSTGALEALGHLERERTREAALDAELTEAQALFRQSDRLRDASDRDLERARDRIERERTRSGELAERVGELNDRVGVLNDRVSEVNRARRTAEKRTAEQSRDRKTAEKRTAEQSRYRETEVARRRELGRQADEAIRAIDSQVRRFDGSTVGRVARALVSIRQMVTPGVVRTVSGPLDPALGDLAVRRDELQALREQEPAPGGGNETMFAGDNALIRRTRPRRRGPVSDRPSVAVLAWDVGHNPLGRANVLAEVLSRHFDVELWGAQFPRYGTQVWAPLRQASTPINVFDGSPLPGHLDTVRQVVGSIRADALWVAKPRLPSYLLGIEAKHARNRPLLLDVDDHELAFFKENTGLDIETLYERTEGLELPFERDWTRLCDGFIDAADQVTVSNVALQERYGGLIVPHARDEKLFDPSRFDREEVRNRLGVKPDERLLLFGGTPRIHKGVVEVLQALEDLNDDRYRVMMFGTREFEELRPSIGDLARWARVLPAMAFGDLPELVAAADLACVVQDPTHPVSRYQMPAKVSDAMVMAIPCLVTRTPPLVPLIDADLVEVLEPDQELHTRIAEIFDDLDGSRARAQRAREWFLAEASYCAVADQIVPVFERLMEDPPALAPALLRLATAAGEVTNGGLADPPAQPRKPRRHDREASPLTPGEPIDIVMFWKQNDSGIYGRRQDMLVQELARSPRVGKIVHFDNPITPEVLVESYRAGRSSAADQRPLVAAETAARVAHRRDEPGITRRTFVFGGRYSQRLGVPDRDAHVDYVRKVLAQEGIGQRPFILWAYPTNPDLPALIDALAPDVVVSDVVDDNRTWYEPGSDRAAVIGDNYRDVLARSDLVLANCEPVARSMEEFVDRVEVVPNGCEMPSGTPRGPRPSLLNPFEGPVIAYVGNLSSRLDVDLLEAVADARPHWNIILVGSAHLGGDALRLGHLRNVHLLGVLPYRKVQDLLAHVDVGLIPHLDNEMTRSMNPLKAFVYAAAGVPVVATPVANLPDLGSLLTLAPDARGFVAAIDDYLAKGRPPVDLALLEPYSWTRRVEQVFAVLDAELEA